MVVPGSASCGAAALDEPHRTGYIVTEPIDATQTSSTGDARRIVELAAATGTTMSDELLLDTLRRNAAVTTRHIRKDFAEVTTGSAVLGYVIRQRKDFVALRGDDPAWAREIGRYPSESLAVEALRMRRG
jgi:hypothetical protein